MYHIRLSQCKLRRATLAPDGRTWRVFCAALSGGQAMVSEEDLKESETTSSSDGVLGSVLADQSTAPPADVGSKRVIKQISDEVCLEDGRLSKPCP